MPADDDWLEHIGNGGGSTNRLPGIPLIESDGLAGFKISGNGGKFDGKLLNLPAADFSVDVILQLFAFDKTTGGQG